MKSKKNAVLETFLKNYSKEEDFFNEASIICRKKLEGALFKSGLKAIVSARAKKHESLKDKIYARNLKKKYKTVKSIYKDIPDLSGVRVALYFPGNLADVEMLIENLFEVKARKRFPEKKKLAVSDYSKRFSGYWATHFRVNLKDNDLAVEQKKYSNANIEIQVASLLMHSWSEVEHDLVYKPKSGSLSKEALSILDEINGLVLVGEVALERLQAETTTNNSGSGGNNPFKNQFDLTSHINVNLKKALGTTTREIGRMDMLLSFLKKIHRNTPKDLHKILQSIIINLRNAPIQQTDSIEKLIVNAIIQENPRFLKDWKKIKDKFSEAVVKNPVNQQFLEVKFLKEFKKINPFVWTPQNVTSKAILTSPELKKFIEMRNQLIHGTSLPSTQALRSSIQGITTMSKKNLKTYKHKPK